jgi:lysophospholipase
LIHTPPKILDFLSHGINVVFPSLRMNSGITVDMATRNQDVIEADAGDTLYITKVSVRWYRELVGAMKEAFLSIEGTKDVPMLVMQAGDDKIVNKAPVKDWFNHAPLSEKRFKEYPKLYHEIFNEPEREDIFEYAKDFVISQLKAIGYIV